MVRIFGPELPVLRQEADRVYEKLKDIPGLVDWHVEQQVEIPQVRIRVNLDAAAQHGLKPGDIRRASALYVSGIEVSDIRRDNRVYVVWLWTPESIRTDVESIRNFPIDTPFGGSVRLGDDADVPSSRRPTESGAAARDGSTSRQRQGRDLGAVAKEVERDSKMSLPIGYYPQLLGEYRSANRCGSSASLIIVLAIFLVLHASLRGRSLGLILLALPPHWSVPRWRLLPATASSPWDRSSASSRCSYRGAAFCCFSISGISRSSGSHLRVAARATRCQRTPVADLLTVAVRRWRSPS